MQGRKLPPMRPTLELDRAFAALLDPREFTLLSPQH
jgi:hypothetical protein